MRLAGVKGVVRGRKPLTTRPAKMIDNRPDLVNRNFSATEPNQLWVADITYVRTLSGFVYTAFVTDVFSRKGECPIVCVRRAWFISTPRIGWGMPQLVG